MTSRELEYLIAVAEEGTITRASEKLHVAQPSLTQQIQKMETEIGCKLLIRASSGVCLTEAGEAYYRMAKQVLRIHEDFRFEIGKLRRLEMGTLRIGASWYITTTFLPGIVSEFAKRHPNVEIVLHESRSGELVELLRAGKLDIALISQSPYELSNTLKRLCCLAVAKDDFCLIAPPKRDMAAFCPGAKASPQQIAVEKLGTESFIMFHPQQRIRQITDAVFHKAKLRPCIQMTTQGFPFAVEQVAAGNGLAILPKRYIDMIKSQYPVQVFSIAPRYAAYWDIGLCHYRTDILPFTLKAFLGAATPAAFAGEYAGMTKP